MDLIQDEILKSHTVDPKTCDLREFGMAIFGHTLVLNKASQPAKFAAVAAPAKSRPATKPQAEPASAAAPAEDDDREQRMLDLTSISNPIICPVREGISKGWDWRFFSNNRAWKQAVKLAGKPSTNDPAALIQILLKGGQQD